MTKDVLRIALTFDVENNSLFYIEKTGEKYSGLTKAIPKVLEMLREQKVPGTYFIAHDNENKIDQEFPSLVESMNENGEIGCHIHFRRGSEKGSPYERSIDFQNSIIGDSTNFLRDIGFDVRSFRGGANFFDENTIKVLEKFDYLTDSSVVPGLYSEPAKGLVVDHKQRLYSKPYFPSHSNHCVPGGSKILEIPISVCPKIRFHNNIFSIFLGRPMFMCNSADVLLNKIDIITYDSMKTMHQSIPIVMTAHSYDFLINTEKRTHDLELFIKRVREELNAKFVTLNEIRNDYIDRKYDLENKTAVFSLTSSDVLQYVNRVSFIRNILKHF